MLERRVRSTGDVNARERVRLALKQRLADRGITNRAFGKGFSANHGKGHVDTWVSGLLKGTFGLSLDELDEAAKLVECSPAELVKSPLEYAEYLTPSEYRFLLNLRELPPAIRDHVMMLTEYLIGVAPEEINYLLEYRKLNDDEQRKIQHWTHAVRMSREPVPGRADPVDLPETTRQPPVPRRRTRGSRR